MNDLVLVPTAGELEKVATAMQADPVFSRGLENRSIVLQQLGFGPIAAAASAIDNITVHNANRVVLVGIAGTFDTERMPVGTARRFDLVWCDGIGAGQGDRFQPASSLGWNQWASQDGQTVIGDCISVPDPPSLTDSTVVQNESNTLLSVCAGSSSPQQRQDRIRRFPGVLAEDMEGFSVAMACHIKAVPLQIVRGSSNEVGDRDHGRWEIDVALREAARLTIDLLSASWD